MGSFHAVPAAGAQQEHGQDATPGDPFQHQQAIEKTNRGGTKPPFDSCNLGKANPQAQSPA